MSIPFDIAALSAQVWNSLTDESDPDDERDDGKVTDKTVGNQVDEDLWASQLHSALAQLDPGPDSQPSGQNDHFDLHIPSLDLTTCFSREESLPAIEGSAKQIEFEPPSFDLLLASFGREGSVPALSATADQTIDMTLENFDRSAFMNHEYSVPHPSPETMDLGLPSLDHLPGFGCQDAVPGMETDPFPTAISDMELVVEDDEHDQFFRALCKAIQPTMSTDDPLLEPQPNSTLTQVSEPSHLNCTPDETSDNVDQMLERLLNSVEHDSSPASLPVTTSSPTVPPTTSTGLMTTIDPLLGALAPSPPTTLSTPRSPQPVLRTDASTSQSILTVEPRPPPPPPPQPRIRQPGPTVSSRPTALLTTSSLEELANPPPGQQPNYPWWTIIRAAIMGSRYGMMRRDEICQALANRWQYFRSTDEHETRVWKSAVGHNLSVKECFVRVHVEGEGNTSYYIVDTAVDPAKGRLSKGKNHDRVAVPRIARRPVLPSNLNLSTQARWSPAIAAIRNAKYGFPEARPTPTSTHAPNPDASESDSSESESESESDSDDSEDSPGPGNVPQPMPGSLLGSSLGAIVGASRPLLIKHPTRNPNSRNSAFTQNALRLRQNTTVPRPAPPAPRKTKSFNASIPIPPSNRRTPARPANRSRRPSPEIPEPIPVHCIPPSPPAISIPYIASSPPAIPVMDPPRSPSPLPLSLEEQVAAALADVTASLPLDMNTSETTNDGDVTMPVSPKEQSQEAENDANSPLEIDIPLFDFDNLVKEVQAEVGNGVGIDDDGKDEDQASNRSEEEDQFDLDKILAAFSSELQADLAAEDSDVTSLPLTHGEVVEPEGGLNEDQGEESGQGTKRSADEAGLGDLLQSLIDRATMDSEEHLSESPPALAPFHENEQSDDDLDGPGPSTAERHLDDAIAEALAAAEAQAQEAFIKELEEREKARMKALSEQVTSSLIGVVQLTPSGDIPVHPLPLPPSAPPASPVQPVVIPRASVVRVNHNRIRSTLTNTRRPTISHPRPTVRTTAGVRPKPTNVPNHHRHLLLHHPIDRRTRAAGVRNPGRRLNLPLPSAHTTPTIVDDRIDETALAPSLLESIQVVTLERPRNTFPELAKEAISSHPGGKMTAAEIFKVVEKKYPYFVTAPESWKATMRNVLTSHSCFVKIPRPADAPGRGDWWSIVDLPLWKRRRTTAKAKQDEDFLGRHAREQMRKGRVHVGVQNRVVSHQNCNNSHNGRLVRPVELNLPRPFNMGL